jgi:hypothetical protein
MKRALVLTMILAGASCAFAQAQESGQVFFQRSDQGVATVAVGAMIKGPSAPVAGAPYSATMTNETVQILTDGTRITQTITGNVARDSQGRTRQDAPLPTFGNLSAADAPHLVFIQDPVAQTTYTLNLSDKTAEKMSAAVQKISASGPGGDGPKFVMHVQGSMAVGDPPPIPPPGAVMMQRFAVNDQDKAATEDLGTQTMEGVQASGVRTTHTIPTGEIGNDRPISVVTEVWTSPDLKTVVYSKRTDPRMGEQTFQLTNINRSEPDASLFTVPADFKVVDGPQDVIYRTNQ